MGVRGWEMGQGDGGQSLGVKGISERAEVRIYNAGERKGEGGGVGVEVGVRGSGKG